MPSPTILERLRHDTRHLHERVEGAVPLLNPTLSVADYLAYLRALLGFYRPLEHTLSCWPDHETALPDLTPRWKSPLLEADLRSLARVSAPSDVPLCTALPRLSTTADLLGCLYVVEGATLGGQVVRRALASRFPGLVANSARFLQGYGADTRMRWTEFCEALSRRPPHEAAAISASAAGTFEAFHGWLRACRVEPADRMPARG